MRKHGVLFFFKANESEKSDWKIVLDDTKIASMMIDANTASRETNTA